jgi:NagD protein
MSDPKPIESWLTDMDGVLVHEEHALPGATEFIAALQEHGRRFLILTNNSIYTARDLRARLLRSGIDVPEDCLWTSALATAKFLGDQKSGGSAYVIGEVGLTSALHDVGFVLTERDPDYVGLGRIRSRTSRAPSDSLSAGRGSSQPTLMQLDHQLRDRFQRAGRSQP